MADPILCGMALWDEVDERVLRWVASRPFSYADSWQLLELHDEADLPDAPELEGLGWRELDDSLQRLHGYGFIAGRVQPYGASGNIWSRLRITAQGLQVTDEWPNFDQVASALGMRMMLQELANAATNEADKTLLQEAGDFAGTFTDAFIKGTINSLSGDVAKET